MASASVAQGTTSEGGTTRSQNESSAGRLARWPLALLTVAAGLLIYPALRLFPGNAPEALDPADYSGRARRILSSVPLIDGHNDLPYILHVEVQDKLYEGLNLSKRLLGHTDLARMQEGQVGGQFWSIFTDCEPVDFQEDPTVRFLLVLPTAVENAYPAPKATLRDTMEQIDVAKRMIDQYPSILQYCEDPDCARQAFRNGRIASMLGIEGGHLVANSIGAIRLFYDLGVRYITTTHNCDNAFATSAHTVAGNGDDNGLTAFGKEYVQELNRLGIMVDLSHVSPNTMRQV